MDADNDLLGLGSAEQLIIEEGYQQSDFTPYPLQDDFDQFLDSGESDRTPVEEGYQQSDFVAPAVALSPEDAPYDWSEPVPDYQFNHFTNVDTSASTPLLEETWFDEGVEQETDWFVNDVLSENLPAQNARQEGDDDFLSWIDDTGYDVTRELIDAEWVLVGNVTPPVTVLMPYVVGMPFTEGFSIVTSVGLNVQVPPPQENVVYPFSPQPAGTIIQQYPLAGSSVVIGSTVLLIVSSGLIVYPQGDAVEFNQPNVVIGDDTPP